MLQFSRKQTCVGEEEQAAFLAEMDAVFKERCRGYHTASVRQKVNAPQCQRLTAEVGVSIALYFLFCKKEALLSSGEGGPVPR